MNENNEKVMEMAEQHGLADADTIALYGEVCEALFAKFDKKNVDSGIGMGECDFHIRWRGVEYHLVMKPHRSIGGKATAS